MMNEEEKREMMMDFERNRQMLASLSGQKQQFEIQVAVIKASLEELKDTKEKSVFKIIGNILISKSVEEMTNELKEQLEIFELRLKTVEKQEETIIKKLNSIKSKIEGKDEDTEEKKTKKK